MIRGESWTKQENIKAALSLAGQAGGGPVLYCENNRCWVHAGESNGIFLGVTGAGKSFCGTQNLVRSLIEAQESFLAVDPKGELYRRNACRMSKDYTVHVIDFRNMLASECVNVLSAPAELYLSGDPMRMKQGGEMLEDLAYTLYAESKSDPFWINSARSVFIAAAYALMECAQPEEINIASVQNLIMQGDRHYSGHGSTVFGRDTYLEHLMHHLPEDSIVSSELYSYISTASDTRGGIRSTMLEGLSRFLRSNVLRGFIANDDLHINELDGQKPLAIWLILPDENPMYSPLAAVIIDQIMRHFVSLAQEKYNGRLPRRMNFLLEEAGNIGRISSLSRMMAAGRSRNIRTFIVLQSLKQLETIYGESEAETIRSNADLTVMYRTNDLYTLEKMSKLCGDRVSDDRVEHDSCSLITPAQLASLKTGQALVILHGSIKFVTELPPCTMAFDPSGWQEPQPWQDLPPHQKPKLFDLVHYVDRKEDPLLDLIEEYESTADDLCSFTTSFLQDSHPKHPFDLDPSKKYQVVIQSWNGRFMRGLKILKDHYHSSSLSDLKNAVETLPYALPFDDKADAEKIYHQLKEEDIKVERFGFEADDA